MISSVCVLKKSKTAEKTDFIMIITLTSTWALLQEVAIQMVDNNLFWRILRTKFST